MCSKGCKLLFLLLTPLICKYKLKATDEDYAYTHAFTKDENRKNFFEIYGKIKEHVLQGIVKGNDKSTNKIKEDIETFNTITRNILEPSDYYKDISERDMLFNNELYKKCLFGLNSNGEVFIDGIYDICQSSKIEKLITLLSFMPKNNWEDKTKNMASIYNYFKGHKEEKEEIENAYKVFMENENELIKLFSEKETKDRYDIDDYNLFIDFVTDNNRARITPPITRNNLSAALFIYVFYFVIKKIKDAIHSFLKEFNSGNFFNARKSDDEDFLLMLINKIILKKKEDEMRKEKREMQNDEQEYQNLISENKHEQLGYSFMSEIVDFVKIFSKRKMKTLTIIFKYTIVKRITTFLATMMMMIIAIIIIIKSIKEILNVLWMKSNDILFRKYYTITNFIKSMYKLYSICSSNKKLKKLYLKDLLNMRKLFETRDKNMRDFLHCVLNSPTKLSTINPANIFRVSNLICNFDKRRKTFINAIVEFILFKNYINAFNIINGKLLGSGSWAIPSITTENNKDEINIKDLHNPKIMKNNNVGNDIYFDNKHRGNLLYGTNGGGKTQLLQAIGCFFLFLNAYGIGHCKEARLSKMDYVYYLEDITTDTSKNLSKFMNEMALSVNFFYYKDKIGDYYTKYKQGSKPAILCIVDEILEGTSFNDATTCLQNFIINSLKDSNVFLFLVHHNPILTKIPKKYSRLKCINSHMGFTKEDILTHTYKIKPGPPKESIMKLLLKKMYAKGLIYDPKYITKSLL